AQGRACSGAGRARKNRPGKKPRPVRFGLDCGRIGRAVYAASAIGAASSTTGPAERATADALALPIPCAGKPTNGLRLTTAQSSQFAQFLPSRYVAGQTTTALPAAVVVGKSASRALYSGRVSSH